MAALQVRGRFNLCGFHPMSTNTPCPTSECLSKRWYNLKVCPIHGPLRTHSQALAETHSPVPPDGCSCASFWTTRGKHKADCALAEAPATYRGEKLYTVNGADEVQFHDGTTLKVDPDATQPLNNLDEVREILKRYDNQQGTIDEAIEAIQRLIREARIEEVKRWMPINPDPRNTWDMRFVEAGQRRIAELKRSL